MLMGYIKQQTNKVVNDSLLMQNGRTKSQTSLLINGSG